MQLAERLAVSDTRITLAHVIETIDAVQFDELKPFCEQLERKAHAAMTRFARRARIGVVQVESA